MNTRENWDETIHDPKSLIKQETAAGRRVFAEWDCGGDCAVVNVVSRDADGKTQSLHNPATARIADFLIDELYLPSVGEHYHWGEGELTLEGRRIYIRFTSKDYYMATEYSWDTSFREETRDGRLVIWRSGFEDEEPTVTGAEAGAFEELKIPLEHEHCVESVLHRTEILLIGEIDKQDNAHVQLRINVVDGDEPTITDTARQYYEERIRMALAESAGRLASTGTRPQGIYVEAPVTSEPFARFRVVSNAYFELKFYNDERLEVKV